MTFEGFHYGEKKMGRNIYIQLNKFMRIFDAFEYLFYTVEGRLTQYLRA